MWGPRVGGLHAGAWDSAWAGCSIGEAESARYRFLWGQIAWTRQSDLANEVVVTFSSWLYIKARVLQGISPSSFSIENKGYQGN